MVIMCGIDEVGAVTGAVCLSSGETLGYEKTYGENMVGKTAKDIDSVDIIAGATLTTTGYKNAISDALKTVEILKGEA
jgi:Na+-transporting NADH:ubiquinone oxidoreductase subunit NqrC